MKVSNFFGDNMPILPWMINFECPKKKCFKQDRAANARNQLEYQAKLSIHSKCANFMLTVLMCTISVNNSEEEFIEQLLRENIRSFCVDMSRGTEVGQQKLLNRLRDTVELYSEKSGRVFPVAIALELTGYRIRTGFLDSVQYDDITLVENHSVYLTTNDNYDCHCNKDMIYVNYHDLLKIVIPGNLIYIDYGSIILEVSDTGKKLKFNNQIKCKVINGGRLRDQSIIHLPNIPFNYEDEVKVELIKFAIKNDVEALIISHVRDSHVLENCRELLGEHKNEIMLIAKIEDATGVANIDHIIPNADGIIIGRCELGLELPPEKLFIVQKSIIAKCNQVGKPAICGGHFLKSMRKNHLPARSEMLDAANAVLDGTDGILLSDEITNSRNVFDAIHNLQNICIESETAVYQKQVISNLIAQMPALNEPIYSIAVSAVQISMKCDAACIIVQTVSGRSAKLIAHYRPRCPIIAVTRYGHVARKLNLWRGVIPLLYIGKIRKSYLKEIDSRFHLAINFGKMAGLIRAGDKLILVSGWKECSGFTNTIRIVYASQNNSLFLNNNKPCT